MPFSWSKNNEFYIYVYWLVEIIRILQTPRRLYPKYLVDRVRAMLHDAVRRRTAGHLAGLGTTRWMRRRNSARFAAPRYGEERVGPITTTVCTPYLVSIPMCVRCSAWAHRMAPCAIPYIFIYRKSERHRSYAAPPPHRIVWHGSKDIPVISWIEFNFLVWLYIFLQW